MKKNAFFDFFCSFRFFLVLQSLPSEIIIINNIHALSARFPSSLFLANACFVCVCVLCY